MNKIIAIYLGPTGLALVGQFQNFTSLVSGIGNASIQTGIVKTTAETENSEMRKTVWLNALVISVFFSILTSLIVFLSADYIAKEFLFESSYKLVVQVFACSIIFYSLNLYILSILNGIGDIRLYSLINIIISILTLIIVSIFTVNYKINGALLAIILTQSVMFFLSYALIYKKYKNNFFFLLDGRIDKNKIKQLLKFGSVSFLSGFIFSSMMIIVRFLIEDNSSLHDAGLWEAAFKIGIYFFMLFNLPVAIYYLPLFSKIQKMDVIKKQLYNFFSFFAPLMFVFIFCIYFFRDFLIEFLFTSDFLMIKDILLPLLLGEFLRVSSSIFGVFFLSKKLFFINISNEFILAFCFCIFVYIFIELDGVTSVAYSYFTSCLIFFFLNIMYFCKFYFECKK